MQRRILAVLMVIVMLAGFAYRCYVLDKPTFAVAISSCSMEPVMCRGDVVFIRIIKKSTELSINQIILFRSGENGIQNWIMHRIVGGCTDTGFITKGDSNCDVDQHCLGYPPVKSEWIGGYVPMIGSRHLIIPKLGYMTLWLDENLRTIPFFTGLLINLALLGVFSLSIIAVRSSIQYLRRRIRNQ